MTGLWVSKWGEREREWNRFKKRKKKKKERGDMWLCHGFQNEGQKREKKEEKKIEEGVSKRVKKERFKKEEYKRERERDVPLNLWAWYWESTMIGREQWGWECLICLFVWFWLKVEKYLKR